MPHPQTTQQSVTTQQLIPYLHACIRELEPVNSGDEVTLDGSCSSDPSGTIESYSWRQIYGHRVHLSDDGISKQTFVAPKVGRDNTLTFKLTVTDDHSKEDKVIKDVCVRGS